MNLDQCVTLGSAAGCLGPVATEARVPLEVAQRPPPRRAQGEDITLITATHAERELADQAAVRDFMRQQRPDMVILAVAKVGGIHAKKNLSC